MNDWHAMSIGESLSTVRQLIRGSLLVVGISVFVIGIVSIRVPAAEQLFPVETIVGTLGSDYTVLAMLGLLAVCFSVIVVVATHRRGIAESDPPAVEATPTAPAPGHSLDVEPGQLFGSWRYAPPDGLHERLRAAAITATANTQDCSETISRQYVATGEWTDDDVASWWLADTSQLDTATQDVGRTKRPNPRLVSQTVEAIAQQTVDSSSAPDLEADQ